MSRALASPIGLRDRRHQRLHRIARRRLHLGDARQRLHHREIGERRIAGDALRQFEALGEALAGLDQIGGEPHGLAFLGRIGAAGEHHVHHARDADQPRQPHRAAAADIDAAAAFRQRVIGRALGDAHMRGRRKLQPAADHRAVQHGDHRHLAELDLLEGAMPEPGMGDALRDVALLQFAQVEAGGEMLAFAGEQHGADVVGQRGEESFDAEDGLVVERVALVRRG